MIKDKKYYRKLVADIVAENPRLPWDQLLGHIKESIENDRSNKN